MVDESRRPAGEDLISEIERFLRDGGERRRPIDLSYTPDAMVRSVVATRYVTPLREGGSVPALVEADDDGLYVVKFRGAGQGPKALVAELLAGEIARRLGLPVPELVLVELDPALGEGRAGTARSRTCSSVAPG